MFSKKNTSSFETELVEVKLDEGMSSPYFALTDTADPVFQQHEARLQSNPTLFHSTRQLGLGCLATYGLTAASLTTFFLLIPKKSLVWLTLPLSYILLLSFGGCTKLVMDRYCEKRDLPFDLDRIEEELDTPELLQRPNP